MRYVDPTGNWILNTNKYKPDKYYQNDSRWGNHKFAQTERTIAEIGCAITTIANGLSALKNYYGILTDGYEIIGLNPDFVNNNMTSDKGANFEMLASYIQKDIKSSVKLIDTKKSSDVINAHKSDKLTLVFAHMKTNGKEGEHWININNVNADGTFNGSDVLADEKGNPKKDYTRSSADTFDRFIILEIDIGK